MRRLAITILLVTLFCCSQENQQAGDYIFRCRIELAPRSETVTATAEGGNAGKAEALAWKALCGKLPEADQEDCRNERKWNPKVSISTSRSGEQVIYRASITIERVVISIKGKGSSEKDKASACRLAVQNACQHAGIQDDCLASGRFVKKGESTSRRLKRPAGK